MLTIHIELWKCDLLKATTEDALRGDGTEDPLAQCLMPYQLHQSINKGSQVRSQASPVLWIETINQGTLSSDLTGGQNLYAHTALHIHYVMDKKQQQHQENLLFFHHFRCVVLQAENERDRDEVYFHE